MGILLVILVLMLGSADKLKTARKIALTGAVSGSANFDGSGNVSISTTQNNIAILTGSFKGNTTVNLPKGFTSKNSVILSVMLNNPLNQNWGVESTFDSSNTITGCLPVKAYIRDSSLVLTCKNINIIDGESPSIGESINLNYRILLMKY